MKETGLTPERHNGPAAGAAPLVIELDADLLGGNLAAEVFWAQLKRDWRSAFVRRPAEPADLDLAHLPWSAEAIARIEAARAQGRECVLRAETPALAEAAARTLGPFDAIEVGPGRRVGPRATRPGSAVAHEVLRAMRPHQWVKNLLVFLPMILGQDFRASALGGALLAFLSFSLIASAVYLLNDLSDLAADRRHPTKRNRPFASGRLAPAHGTRLLPVLLLGGFGLAWIAGGGLLLAIMALYLAATTAYSLRLKGVLAADIILLAGLYTLRVFAGAAAISVVPSMWLLSFTIFAFFSLGAVKRLSELVTLEASDHPGKPAGRAYVIEDRPVVAMIATSAGFIAVLVLTLYLDSSEVRTHYGAPELLWGISLVLLFWISRVVLLAHRGLVNQDPVIFALTDRVSLWSGVAMAVFFVGAMVG